MNRSPTLARIRSHKPGTSDKPPSLHPPFLLRSHYLLSFFVHPNLCFQTFPLFSQEKQLQEAAKNNEEAQGVIKGLRASLQRLEIRFKQARKKQKALPSYVRSIYVVQQRPLGSISPCTAGIGDKAGGVLGSLRGM